LASQSGGAPDRAVASPGSAAAATTTLLAALWPDEHQGYDWRVHAAVNGLRISSGLEPTDGVDPHGVGSPPPSFSDYAVIRRWLITTSTTTKQPLAQVERAL
jgi:hypothetical protein